jgi:hypothetical protein
MLGFALSKMNLLILVTALFGIIAFFLFTLTDMMVARSAQQMVNDLVETTAGITTGDAFCKEETVTIPEEITYFSGKRFYYIMKISREPAGYNPEYLSKLIFKVAARKEQSKFIATNSYDMNAEILLYQWPVAGGGLATDLKEQSSIILDPMSETLPSNSVKLIKEVYNGENFLHVIACNTGSGQCEMNKGYAGCCVKQWRDGKASTCLPPAENCPSNLSCYSRA